MKKLIDYVAEAATVEKEVMPWDMEEVLEGGVTPLILDIREPYEFYCMHIDGSNNVPRGVLESACEWDYEETIPELVNSRDRDIVIVCRSGHRSLLAGRTLKEMVYSNVRSLKTGLRGWNGYEMPMVRQDGEDQVIEANADKFFTPQVMEDQLKPKKTQTGPKKNIFFCHAGLDLVYRYLSLFSNSSINTIIIHYCIIMIRYFHFIATRPDFPFGKKLSFLPV